MRKKTKLQIYSPNQKSDENYKPDYDHKPDTKKIKIQQLEQALRKGFSAVTRYYQNWE